ncbi:ISLre2 family transposase [Pediococcus damnosus]|uniref:ISLre2 family transposase n=1 Tax=Pediococcus damnosus TaxID=51663 RepID=UPI003F6D2C3B
MSQILTEIMTVLKDSNNLFDAEQNLMMQCQTLIATALGQALEDLDDLLIGETEYQEIVGKRERTLNFMCGAVTFKRRLVKLTDKKYVFPLDRYLQLIPRSRFSPLMVEKVAKLASHSVLRTTALAVNLLTPLSISHQKVGQLYQTAGTQCEKQREETTLVTVAKKRQVPYLYLEGDAFCVAIKAKHHHKNIFVHRLQLTEGITQNGQRRQTLNRHVFTGLNRRVVFKQAQDYLSQNYDLQHTTVTTGSDNGSGYEPSCFDELAIGAKKHEHFLDCYHLNRKIRKRLSMMPKKLQNMLFQAVHNWDSDQIQVILDTCESIASDTDSLESIQLLRRYLKRNWNYLKPAVERSLTAENVCLGGCESNHRRFTYRLKHQGRSWSIPGLKAMVNVITSEINGQLEAAMLNVPAASPINVKPVNISASHFLKQPFTQHQGIKHGSLHLDAATSSAMGNLVKIIS